MCEFLHRCVSITQMCENWHKMREQPPLTHTMRSSHQSTINRHTHPGLPTIAICLAAATPYCSCCPHHRPLRQPNICCRICHGSSGDGGDGRMTHMRQCQGGWQQLLGWRGCRRGQPEGRRPFLLVPQPHWQQPTTHLDRVFSLFHVKWYRLQIPVILWCRWVSAMQWATLNSMQKGPTKDRTWMRITNNNGTSP